MSCLVGMGAIRRATCMEVPSPYFLSLKLNGAVFGCGTSVATIELFQIGEESRDIHFSMKISVRSRGRSRFGMIFPEVKVHCCLLMQIFCFGSHRCDLTRFGAVEKSPSSLPADKYVLRLAASLHGLQTAANAAKRAIQFGSRSGRIFGTAKSKGTEPWKPIDHS